MRESGRTWDRAIGKWKGILMQFGIDESFLANRHGPCVLCGGKDRWRWDDKEGTGSYLCSQCGAGTGMGLLMAYRGWDFATAAREVDKIVGNVQAEPVSPKSDPTKRIMMVANRLKPVTGEVRQYLANRSLKPCRNLRSATLDYFEDRQRLGEYTCMVCPIQNKAGDVISYHLTYLQEGRKADVSSPRKMLPPSEPMAGAAIRLTDVYACIGIAEGVETALAVMEIYKLPCWAAASAHMLETFQPPEGVSHVMIYSDHDANFTGQKAAYTLANRLAIAGYTVGVFLPEIIGDYADVLKPKHVSPVIDERAGESA